MKEVNVHELKKMLDEKEDFQLIDVREPKEHEYSNIGGDLIPMGTIFNRIDQINREKKVVVYCRSGSRSANVVRALEQRYGFENLYNLKGGILDWSDEIDPSIPKY
jgi:sulfur-carrier protein adenylyltransferase/sulfurtransferase